jgi:HAMP domain-containing protein
MFSNFGIATRLWMLVCMMLVAMCAIGGYGAWGLRASLQQNEDNLRLARELITATDEVRSADLDFRVQVEEFEDLALRGYERAEHDKRVAAFRKRGEEVAQHLAAASGAMRKLGMDTTDADDAARMHRELVAGFAEALRRMESGKREDGLAADAAMHGKDRPLAAKMDKMVDAVKAHARSEGVRVRQAAAAWSTGVQAALAGVFLVVFVASAVMSALLIRSVRRPVREVIVAATRVAEGDLAHTVEVHGRDETGPPARKHGAHDRPAARTAARRGGARALGRRQQRAARARQRGPLAAHGGTGVHAGGDGGPDGGTHEHRLAERRERAPGARAGGACRGRGHPRRRSGGAGRPHHGRHLRVVQADRRHHRRDRRHRLPDQHPGAQCSGGSRARRRNRAAASPSWRRKSAAWPSAAPRRPRKSRR